MTTPTDSATVHPSAAKGIASASLALGLIIAIAANLTYAIPRGPVTIGLGLIAPLVLPVALYIRTTFTAAGFFQILAREIATLAVAGPAAAISYVHTYELVLSVNEPWILAVLAPLSSDGLAGMATLALHRLRANTPAAKQQAPKTRQRRDDAPSPAAAEPTTTPPKPVKKVSLVKKASARPATKAVDSETFEKAMQLISDGLGRVKLARVLDVDEYVAKQLIKAHRNNGNQAVTS